MSSTGFGRVGVMDAFTIALRLREEVHAELLQLEKFIRLAEALVQTAHPDRTATGTATATAIQVSPPRPVKFLRRADRMSGDQLPIPSRDGRNPRDQEVVQLSAPALTDDLAGEDSFDFR